MSYVLSPDPTLVCIPVAGATMSPFVSAFQNLCIRGQAVQIIVVPAVAYRRLHTGEALPTTVSTQHHGIPGETTLDDEWPDPYRPEMRVNYVPTPDPPEYVVALYHGEPGVLRGDDNWSQENPSYQPQLRTNTIDHTTDPTLVEGTWRVNEAFLPQ